ncbi:MAG: DNA glycosylase [Tissierellia bacterium]|nr:DNA glycosylase [Tissierellia bacterium]
MVRSDILGEIDLDLCLRSGQAFHWIQLGETYVIVSGHRVWQVFEREDYWEVTGSQPEALRHYLDGDRDYNKINMALKEDLSLALLVERGRGLRILNQEIWDTVVAFILSTNNSVKKIQSSILKISQAYGDRLGTFSGQDIYSLPSPQRLAQVDPEDLRVQGKTGYRDKYLVESAKMIASGQVDLEGLRGQEAHQIRKELMTLPGVGPKAAECILLFGYGCRSSFPVDVWIERTMQTLYGPFSSREEISSFGRKKFGPQAGYVQQLLFHYGRTHKNEFEI